MIASSTGVAGGGGGEMLQWKEGSCAEKKQSIVSGRLKIICRVQRGEDQRIGVRAYSCSKTLWHPEVPAHTSVSTETRSMVARKEESKTTRRIYRHTSGLSSWSPKARL